MILCLFLESVLAESVNIVLIGVFLGIFHRSLTYSSMASEIFISYRLFFKDWRPLLLDVIYLQRNLTIL